MVIFTARYTNLVRLKICELHRAIFFLILQHFATNFCKFTNFNGMLFPAVVMDFVPASCLDQHLVYSWNHLLIISPY